MPFLVKENSVKYFFFENILSLLLVKSWFFDQTDTCLLSLLPFLDALRFCHDVRSVLAMNLHLHQNTMITNTNSLTTQVIPLSIQ
jgi:TFIIF-interacting CTD phosphatase-like protein